MDNLQSKKNYGIKAFFPLIVFLIIYLGSGIFFTLMGGFVGRISSSHHHGKR